MKERLLKFLNMENLSATRFADEIGVQRSSISHILSGRNKPSYDFIYKTLEKFSNINAEWLINGKGSMYKEDHEKVVNKVSEELSFDTGVKKPENKLNSEPTQEKVKDIINKQVIEQKNIEKRNIFDVKSVEKVIIFFSDGKFKEYSPEE